MKKISLLSLIIFLVHSHSFSQESQTLNDYVFKAGDVLEYEVSKAGKIYRLVITLTGKTTVDAKIVDAITFSWQIAGDTNSKGVVVISKQARTDANTYQTELTNGASAFKHKSCFWLSLTDKHMIFSSEGQSLDIGDGKRQLYKIQQGSAERYYVRFKGKPAYFSSFKATSVSGNNFNFYGTMNSNSLLLSISAELSIQLKEIR
jgi:hypothetical protein